MLYKAVEKKVIMADETEREISSCYDKSDAELIASALNMREANLRRFAEAYIEIIDTGEGKMQEQWHRLMKANNVNYADALTIWKMVLELINE